MHTPVRYSLGLDLGSNSLGWAALRLDGGEAAGVLASGVRIFPAGIEQLESGGDESPALKRRQARLQRRQTDRRRRRIQKIYNLLAGCGLMPPAPDPATRSNVVAGLDRSLSARYGDHRKLPYVLRAAGLDQKLDVYELGRALYHLAQRRGFLSNRKSNKEGDKEQGVVRPKITELQAAIAESGCRTLGEFLSRLDPAQARIRGRYTSRAMYAHEFELLWSVQTAHHPELLTSERKNALWSAMFFQRPLRDQSDLIGNCELEPTEKRALCGTPLCSVFGCFKRSTI